MSDRNCYFDANGCYVCPELPAVPARPPTTTTDAQLGWNAGANSVKTLAGDVHVVWSFDTPPAGVLLGLKGNRELPAEFALLPHALYVNSVGGNAFVTVVEMGRLIGSAHTYIMSTPLEIRRVGTRVSYLNNGALLASSEAKVMGPVMVNTCLYAAGDTVP